MTTDLTRQKFRDTNLLDRSHIVDDPRTLPTVVRHLIKAHGRPLNSWVNLFKRTREWA